MTISLVPAGQPHGQRQVNEDAADEAGLSKKVGQEAPSVRPVPTVPRQAVKAPSFEQGGFDAFTEASPTQFGNLRSSSDSPMLDVLATSPNAQLRDLADRLRGF